MTISRNPSSIFELTPPSGQKYTIYTANSKLLDIFASGKDDKNESLIITVGIPVHICVKCLFGEV